MSVEWVEPGRLLVSSVTSPREVPRLVSQAETVQWRELLPEALRRSLAESLSERPEVEVYVYGHYGQTLPSDLSFLAGLEHVRQLSLNLRGVLAGVDGLERFRHLRSLYLQVDPKRPSIVALRNAPDLEVLSLGGPVQDAHVIGELAHLRELRSPATAPILEALVGHRWLRRLRLTFGTARDLSALATCPSLTDLELYQVRSLDARDLDPLARIARLEALALGALRNVTDLRGLGAPASSLRWLTLEKLPALDTYAPLADHEQLRAFGSWEARPADRSLAPLTRLPLEDVSLGDAYPLHELEALIAAGPTLRLSARRHPGDPPSRIRWRGLFSYMDKERTA